LRWIEVVPSILNNVDIAIDPKDKEDDDKLPRVLVNWWKKNVLEQMV
jgi:hypothetical protein